MKKTIIAILALSGVAIGANHNNLEETSSFAQAIAAQQDLLHTTYNGTENFTLSYDLTIGIGGNDGGVVMALVPNTAEEGSPNNSWGLFSQQGRYMGVDAGLNGVGGGLVTNYGTQYTYDGITTSTDGWFMDTGSINGLSGYKVTIIGTAASGDTAAKTVITFEKDGKNTVTLNCASLLNANDFRMNALPGKASASNISFTFVPEPATATLSLLALAGLAARRRRH